MKTIYMLSGFDKTIGFYKNQAEHLKKDIKNNSSITFIASDFKDNVKTDKHINIILNAFNDISITFSSVYKIDNRTTKKDTKEYIKNSDVIFIMGGDTFEEFKSIKDYDLVDSLKMFDGIIIGVSAGSLNMSKNVCYLDEYRDYSLVEYEGIGLTDINIYPHFDLNNEDFVDETLEVSKKTKLYALPNESFIKIKDNSKEIIGKYYIAENNEIIEAKDENN